ncbi:ribosome silencing factor [Pseudoroseomonas cervicalis]|uniref:ribosome silencing factor n=1 Tax=Teichococcus cervicalis TaxID=204525 RepID=UPI0002D927BF
MRGAAVPKVASRVAAAKSKAASVTPKPAAKAAAAPKPKKAAAPKPAETRKLKAPKRQKLTPPQIDLIVQAAVRSLEDDKAEDVVVLDVASRAAFADRMIVATGLADRQIQAMAAHLDKVLAEHGIRRIRTETSPDWVLLDAGDLIVHLFKPEARANYRLEKMWGPDSPPAGDEAALPPGLDRAEDGLDEEEEDLDDDLILSPEDMVNGGSHSLDEEDEAEEDEDTERRG